MENIYARRLNLKNALNLRELGGYMRGDGKVTKYNQFLRSGNPSRLDKSEVDFLLGYGLKTVIDLRDHKEVGKEKSALSQIPGVEYCHISLFDAHMREGGETFDNLGQVYVRAIEKAQSFGQIYNTMAKHTDGVILFNCTAGKDRTGLTAALLLMLAGVDECDIVADYQVSFTYFKGSFEKTLAVYPDMPMHYAHSDAEWIESILHMINRDYGNVESFLTSRGVTEESVQILKNKLI